MTFKAYVFPAKFEALAELRLDEANVSQPLPIYSGPHAGKVFLDADLAARDERWIPLFGPLIVDPTNEVALVDLELSDITVPEPKL